MRRDLFIVFVRCAILRKKELLVNDYDRNA